MLLRNNGQSKHLQTYVLYSPLNVPMHKQAGPNTAVIVDLTARCVHSLLFYEVIQLTQYLNKTKQKRNYICLITHFL